jgi:hypothetical protein
LVILVPEDLIPPLFFSSASRRVSRRSGGWGGRFGSRDPFPVVPRLIIFQASDLAGSGGLSVGVEV